MAVKQPCSIILRNSAYVSPCLKCQQQKSSTFHLLIMFHVQSSLANPELDKLDAALANQYVPSTVTSFYSIKSTMHIKSTLRISLPLPPPPSSKHSCIGAYNQYIRKLNNRRLDIKMGVTWMTIWSKKTGSRVGDANESAAPPPPPRSDSFPAAN